MSKNTSKNILIVKKIKMQFTFNINTYNIKTRRKHFETKS